ncbi:MULTISPECIES: isoleucine--tRNA ligase [Butyricimonas]|uniref:isoleucine--tRNA ligase n=1 Tax=Butyricimonas TaxID=574697 RepID=UPI0007FB2AC2|nr:MULTISPECIES: isoleucine--tRNA ligase [Butyricimonas]
MDKKFQEYKGLDLSQVNKDVLKEWKAQHTFEESLKIREGHPSFVFFEGPPSANGMPGIHHVMARTIKDIICRYKTLQGFLVERKAGWDTHGLPVELGVEKKLGITKENIGKTISVADYNKECRADVMKFTREWEDLTDKMGYWVNMEDPYITYDNRYIETLWYLLKQLYEKGFLYKGYTIQPYSPAAGTGLSTHELNQPGCYRDVKDTTCVAQFKVIRDEKSEKLFAHGNEVYFTAWTTTPWTLPSNTALAVGPTITYLEVKTYNPYTFRPVTVIMAKDRFSAYFNKKAEDIALGDYKEGDKLIPYEVVAEYKGTDLEGMRYEQLLPWMKPMGDAFRVILGDYVSTEDGTGIVHIAPTFGADDDRVAKVAGIAPLMLIDKEGNKQPMVDKQGRLFLPSEIDADFLKNNVDIELYAEFAGRFVKNAYDPELSDDAPTLDIDLSILLKRENKAFKVEKHEHNYPHCWRTDKPVLYYPLDSWFIKTTAVRDRMIELNKTINWKPASTGEGRFGKWLENLVDWNLSRSRYWGTPLPIWVSEDGTEKKCIGSVKELAEEIEKAIQAGVMKESPFKDFKIGDYSKENYDKIDLHRPYVDDIILVSATGQPMYREKDLIDVWFDSGAMPYAQVHYPFENKELIDNHIKFPADFIAEGVDQTRGWFFTLHAIATMVFDSVAFKNIISNGLVLDAKGNKMSKRLGNAVDPFDTIEKQGSDPLRWYMITNSQPWDNLKFDIAGVEEVKRKFFGTLYNTYSFFALYANIDNFTYAEAEVPFNERPEIDRWILSLLNSLIKEVTEAYESYEPTRAGRAIQNFVIENLSNWYVRLSRKRYWGGEQTADKLSAYQTLYTCLETVSILSSPIAPFYMDRLFRDLNNVTGRYTTSVHLVDFPVANDTMIDKQLEERMDMAQQISSMVLGLRRKVQIRVRQPLCKLLIPILNEEMTAQLDAVKSIILSEVNVKEIEYITDTAGILIKKIKPNFKTLGPKYGKYMKQISALVAEMDQSDIYNFEKQGTYSLQVGTENLELTLNDVEILSEDIPGWLVANEGRLTVALDINITKELREEGIARELINRIQNLRKESNFNVTNKIDLQIGKHKDINDAVENFKEYIASQVLAENVTLVDKADEDVQLIEIDDIHTFIKIQRM